MKKVFLLPILIISLSISAYSQEHKAGSTLLVDETLHFEEMFSVVKDNIAFLTEEQMETDNMKRLLSEAEGLFFRLKYLEDIKDPELMKRHLSTIVADLVQESGERVAFVQRMNLLYWMMLSIGLFIVFLMLVYSIYMYSRRK
jgi:hypothetical protein